MTATPIPSKRLRGRLGRLLRAAPGVALSCAAATYVAGACAAGPGPAQSKLAMVPPADPPSLFDAHTVDPPFVKLGAVDAEVRFESGRALLMPSSRAKLDDFARRLRRFDAWTIVLIGHLDSQEASGQPGRLDGERVEAIMTYLMARGVDSGLFHVQTRGNAEPVTPADACRGAGANELARCLEPDRRVEIEMLGVPAARKR